MMHEATHSPLHSAPGSPVVVPRRSRAAESPGDTTSSDPSRLHVALDSVLRTSGSELEATGRWLTIVCHSLHASFAALYGSSPTTGQEMAGTIASTQQAYQPLLGVLGATGGQAAVPDALARPLIALVGKASADGIVQFARVGSDLGQLAVAVPVSRADGVTEALVLLLEGDVREPSTLTRIAREVQLQASFAGAWRGRWSTLREPAGLKPTVERPPSPDPSPDPSPAPAVSQDDLLAALAATAATTSLEEVAAWWCRFAVRQATERKAAERMVAVGRLRWGGTCRLLAVAPERTFTATAPLVGCIEAVMAEAVLRTDEASGSRPDRRATQAMQQLRELSAAPQIRTLLLRDATQQVRGVCLMWGERPWSNDEWARWEAWGRLAGVHLGLAQSARGWLPVPRLQRWRSLSMQQRLGRALVASALSAALLAVPVPCRISCRADLQPADRRLVVAPHEGRLEEALVRPGDWVASGQLLARLDGRDLRLELASLEAERSRVAKERDRSMAASDTAASQLAALELRRLDLKREGIDARLQRLEIRSPLAGQVIGGDPQVWVGSRLTQGQSLVEVAAPGTLVLELSIPDADIDRAIVGKTVHCRLESLPGVSLEGRLKSIRPRAEVRDGENVFVGLVELRMSPEGDHSELRPGMRGRARLEAEPRTLAWQVFHRAWEQLQFRWGW